MLCFRDLSFHGTPEVILKSLNGVSAALLLAVCGLAVSQSHGSNGSKPSPLSSKARLSDARSFRYLSQSPSSAGLLPSPFLSETFTPGMIYTYVGDGQWGYSGDGGLANDAAVDLPDAVASDAAGNLYFSDTANHAVRMVSEATRIITTIAGNGSAGYAGDGGPATGAQLNNPMGLALDAAGNLFIADSGNNRVRKLNLATGIIATVAGNGNAGSSGDTGAATSGELSNPVAVTLDAKGNLYIADAGNDRIRSVNGSSGVISTYAGSGIQGFSGDGGPASLAELNSPAGIVFDSSGNLIIADSMNQRIRTVASSTGYISTVAGTGVYSYRGDGGPAIQADLNVPTAVAFDSAGNLYIGELGNLCIRMVSAKTGIISSAHGLAAGGQCGIGTWTNSMPPGASLGLAFDAAGDLFMADPYYAQILVAIAQLNHDPIPTTTTVTAYPTTLSYGETVTLAATVTGASGATPVGTIYYPSGIAGSNTLGTLDNNGVAVNVGTPDPGVYSVTANYSGSPYNASSTSSPAVMVTVAHSPTTTSLAASSSMLTAGEPLTLTATVTTPNGTTPSGYITFSTAAGNLDYYPVPLNSAGIAQITYVPQATDGSIYATFSGTSGASGHAGYLSSKSSAIRVVVNSAPQPQSIYTIAGTGVSGFSGDGGSALTAQLGAPVAVAADSSGNLYVLDPSNLRVRMVNAKTGIISTVAGNGTMGSGGDGGVATSAQLNGPTAIALDAAGNLFIADAMNYRIRKVSANGGVITTVAGDGQRGAASPGGQAIASHIGATTGLAVDIQENLYIADSDNNAIWMVAATTGTISVLAGNSPAGYSGDGGPASLAAINLPAGVGTDAAGNVYITDTGNYRIRKVDAETGLISTVAGAGTRGFSGDGGLATTALLDRPAGIAVDLAGDIYFSDGSNARVRMVNASTGIIGTVAGSGVPGFGGDGGPAPAALINSNDGLAIDGAANLYLAEPANARIRVVGAAPHFSLTPTTTTVSFSATSGQYGIGQQLTLTAAVTAAKGGTPTGTVSFFNGLVWLGSAPLNSSGLATLPPFLAQNQTTLFIAASYGGSPTYAASTSTPPLMVVVGSQATVITLSISSNPLQPDQTATFTATVSPVGSGKTPQGLVTFSGDLSLGSVNLDKTGAASVQATLPVGTYAIIATFMPFDQYAASVSAPLSVVVKDVPSSSPLIFNFAGTDQVGVPGAGGQASETILNGPSGMVVDAAGNLYFSDSMHNLVRRVDAVTGILTNYAGNGGVYSGGDGGPATNANIWRPGALAFDPAGNLLIAELQSGSVRKVNSQTGIITTVAGTGSQGYWGDGGLATKAQLNWPAGIAVDSSGNLYISDSTYNSVREVDVSTGIIHTIAGGINWSATGDGGPAINAVLSAPTGLAVDSANNLYISETGGRKIRKVDAKTGIITTFAGTGTAGYSGDQGSATGAKLQGPTCELFDSAGNLYFGDSGTVRRIDGMTGIITTVAGTGIVGYSGNGGPADRAKIQWPQGLAFSSAGGLLIADNGNNRIRVVGPATPIPTITTFTASPATLTVGQTLNLSVSVAQATGAVPKGTASFYDGSVILGSALLDASGTATLALTPSARIYHINARYGGSLPDAASIAETILTVTVNGLATTTSLAPIPSSAQPGDSIPLTAAVTSPFGTPTGTIVFYDGSSELGVASLESGVASYTANSLNPGSHNIYAVYSGGPRYSASVSNTLVEAITGSDFSLTVLPSSGSLFAPNQFGYIVAVTPKSGFNLPVELACAGLPANTSCTFSPSTITGGRGSARLVVKTTGATRVVAASAFSFTSGLAALASLLLLFLPWRIRRSLKRWPLALLLLASLVAGAALSGCNGQLAVTGATPLGMHTITVTAHASNGTRTVSHSTAIAIDVEPQP